MKNLVKITIFTMLLFGAARSGNAQNNNFNFPPQVFAGAMTGTTYGVLGESRGTLTLKATALTTVTFVVYGSGDNALSWTPIPVAPIATPASTALTTTATTQGVYVINTDGLTNIRVVTTTVTGTNVTFKLTTIAY